MKKLNDSVNGIRICETATKKNGVLRKKQWKYRTNKHQH